MVKHFPGVCVTLREVCVLAGNKELAGDGKTAALLGRCSRYLQSNWGEPSKAKIFEIQHVLMYHADLSRAPGLRCRSGRAVEFKHGSSGKAVTAILEISERSTDQGNVFNVKVFTQCQAPLQNSLGLHIRC